MTATQERPFIVVGADGSDASIGALRWSLAQARLTGARLVVVTAFNIPWTIMITPTYTDDDYARDAQEMLDRTILEAIGHTVEVPVEAKLLQLRPALALTGVAKGADLLVVGAKGQGELPGMHLGSVASYCVHHAPCPVVVYRDRD
ncbi:MAG TPA: universal stress protein UspA [Actinobacteria bacterium]|nr:universal stress protein UspA [Actinomycetota bacterium]